MSLQPAPKAAACRVFPFASPAGGAETLRLEYTKEKFQEGGKFNLLSSPTLVASEMHWAPELRCLVNNPQFSDVCFMTDSASRVYANKGAVACMCCLRDSRAKPACLPASAHSTPG